MPSTPPAPNTQMQRQQLHDLIDLANNKQLLATYGPYILFDPSGSIQYGDMKPPYIITYRGIYNPNELYTAGSMVSFTSPMTGQAYLFISVFNQQEPPNPPLNAQGKPNDNFSWQQPWWSCYQRMRWDLGQAVNNAQIADFIQAVSGPWPVPVPNLHYDELAFYYADTGNQESVTVNGDLGLAELQAVGATYEDAITMWNFGWSRIVGDGAPSAINDEPISDTTDGSGNETIVTQAVSTPAYRAQWANSATFEVDIGGSQPLPLSITLEAFANVVRGTTITFAPDNTGTVDSLNFAYSYDGVDPTSLVSADVSAWIPGAALTVTAAPWPTPDPSVAVTVVATAVTLKWTVNGTVPPGKYRVTITASGTPNNRASGQLTFIIPASGPETVSGAETWTNDAWAGMANNMTITGGVNFISNQSVEVPGVHNAKKVMKIPVVTFSEQGIPAGVIGTIGLFQFGPDGTDYTIPPYALNGVPLEGLRFVGTEASSGIWPITLTATTISNPNPINTIYFDQTNWTIDPSTLGYFIGKTPPIASLGLTPWNRMPWNQFPTSADLVVSKLNLYTNSIAPHTGGPADGGFAQLAYNGNDAPDWVKATNSTSAFDSDELLPWPKFWKPGVLYPAGFNIVDSYGNIQTVSTSGRSSTTPPAWPFELGELTAEHPTGADPGVVWKLTKKLKQTPTRAVNTAYPVGQTVIDGNGNQQTSIIAWLAATAYARSAVMIDSNNNVQQVQTAGTSGRTVPMWGTDLAALTTDGTVVWKVVQLNAPPFSDASVGITQINWSKTLGGTVNDGTVVWKLTKGYPTFTPPVARLTPPVYPVYWQNKPGGATPPGINMGYPNAEGQPQWNFLYTQSDPQNSHSPSVAGPGLWIYRVAINRIPQTKTTAPPPSGTVPVTIGCVRNGAFVAFGTYNTGQIIDAMWPVFTEATALAYQCSEQVDFQAEMITCGTNFGTWGNVTYPMAAAYINDLTAILNLLS